MGRISTGVGLISGINSAQIIDQLIQLDSGPVTQLQQRITTANAQKDAYNGLLSQLSDLKTVGTTLTNPLTFQAATANSSDQNVLTATAAAGAAVGTFQFQVARLVSAQQAVTAGFADPNQTKVGAGTITISQGGGELSSETNLSALNGGAGVRRGDFRITDRSGHTAVIDISSAVTLDDVARKINTALDISVKATVGRDGLVLTDQSGQTTSNLSVQEVGDGNTAADLGLVGSVADNTLTGGDINSIGRATALAQVNDGRGIRLASSAGADVRILAGDGTTFDVSLATAKTVGQVLDLINTAGAGKIRADVPAGGDGIRLTDLTGGGGAIVVADLNGSKAAEDLGLTATATGTLNGGPLIAALNSTLLSSLRGGAGVPLGEISITDRLGNAATVDLSGATSVQDVINGINNAGTGVRASLNASGNGLQLTDTTGGTGNLVVADVNSTTAAALGLAGTYNASVTTVGGANLHRQYITTNTLLSDYNGGKGVTQGKFRITASNGTQADIDLSSGNFVTLGDVIKNINSRGIGVTASINANGNGLLLTDTAGGGGQLKVENTSGTPATDLNIIGTAAAGATTIDGALEKTISVDVNDTLSTVATKINSLGFAVTASIINDGSGATPYRLSLTATDTGRDGRFVFDAGTSGLATSNLVEAQDAAAFLGGAGNTQPLLLTSSTNQLTNVIKGVTVDLHNVSSNPVTLSVSRDGSGVSDQLKKFTDGFNAIITKLGQLTSFDTKTNTPGLLLGDSTADSIQIDLYNIYNSVVKNAGRYTVLSQVGIGISDGAQLSFDADKFSSAFGTDPDAVKNLFAQATTGLGTLITNQINKLTDPANGLIPLETQTIDTQTKDFQDRITELNALLQQKRDRLTQQFANMETVLANLQSQQQTLGSIGTLLSSAPRSSSSSSPSSPSSTSSSGNSTTGA
jgi:flagellar hook-associated protein 2